MITDLEVGSSLCVLFAYYFRSVACGQLKQPNLDAPALRAQSFGSIRRIDDGFKFTPVLQIGFNLGSSEPRTSALASTDLRRFTMPPEERKELAALPPELFFNVASFLPVSALAAFSTTCRALHFQLEPSLYKSIDWNFPFRNREEATPEYLLLRTLLRRPLLASYIKSVSIHAPSYRHSSFYSSSSEQDQVIGELCVPFPTKIECPARSGDPGAMTVLLLFRLRHLNVLVLHPEISSSVSRLIRFGGCLSEIGRCLFTYPYFQQLKEVYLPNTYDVDSIVYDRQELVRILPNLPFLEILDIFLRDTIESPLDLFSQVPFQLPRLRTLGIVNSDYDTETATCLFCAAPNLVTLEYYLSQDIIESFHARLYWAKWAYLMASLKAVSKTFKSLTISTMGSDRDHPLKILQPSDFEYSAWEMQGLLSSLNSLDVLERLDVPIFALLGPRPNFSTNKLRDILPSSLRELCIRDDLNYGKAFNLDPRLFLDEFWHSQDILEQLRD
ncbi:hypothetical protein FQN55_005265 [Onygenales sp. PD_40]|nr:hypothetical protein FQN55_005265 [Onygenales sp. PD_40]